MYPQWQINTYAINYDSNGGLGSMDYQIVEWQETFTLSQNAFKREGYKFVGWYFGSSTVLLGSMTATNYIKLDWELISRMLTDAYQGMRKQYAVEC